MMNSVKLSKETIPSRDYFTCRKCGVPKRRDEFAPSAFNGRNAAHCKACCAAYQRARRAAGIKPSGRNTRIAKLSPEARARHFRISSMLDSAQSNSRKRGRSYDLDAQYVEQLWQAQHGKCALSGLPLSVERGQYVASLDQIKVAGGYVRGNVRLVCWAVNRGRGELDDADYIELCRQVVRCNDYPERE